VDRSIRAIPYEELMESSSRHPPARAAREMQARFASIFVLLAALIDHALVNPRVPLDLSGSRPDTKHWYLGFRLLRAPLAATGAAASGSSQQLVAGASQAPRTHCRRQRARSM
jgi:hypothetical protein